MPSGLPSKICEVCGLPFNWRKKWKKKLGRSKILQRKMPKKQKINILWFTKDLRTRDSESLYNILQEDLPFLAVYVFDADFFQQQQFGFKKIGKFRAKFLLESIDYLKQNLSGKNIPFLMKYGNPEDVFREISEKFEIVKIFCQEEWTKEETIMQTKIRQIIPDAAWEKPYSQFLVHPLFVFKTLNKIPMLFTTFRQKIEKNLLIRPEFESENLIYNKEYIVAESDEISIETLGFEDFEPDKRSAFPFSGGEDTALKRLHYYFRETQSLSKYKETRNGLSGTDYSSKFSPWLSDGSISAVTIYHEIKKYEEESGANDSTYWLIFELLWRDFFRYISLQHKDLIFRKTGINHQKYFYKNNEEAVQKWKDGKTDSDFVNANMLELKNTGWMSNRGRQNAASYFCKVLKQDWRIGAAYFEEMLIDYDVHSNYGNWMYLAGVGNDNRNRIFNPEKQAEMYDPNEEFRKLWLKRIKHTAQLVFPHQLFKDTDYLHKDQPVFLLEEFLFFKQYSFHQQKIAFHRATMKFYENELRKSGFEVEYIESSSKFSDIRNLIPKLEKEGYTTLRTTDVCDNWLEKRLQKTNLEIEILDSPLFINTKEDLKEYFNDKKSYHQTDFYKQQRITRNILMKAGKPLGGKWTYDTENRKRYPKNKKAPAIHFPVNNGYYEEAKQYTEKYFAKNYGTLTEEQLYPTTFKESEKWLEQFLEMRFHEFGIYEDSMVEKEHFLHHSILSPLMNAGLLTAENVLEKAISFAKDNDVPVNSLEGFVRQILGWREFVRGVYIYQGTYQRNKNYWKHQQELPESFYTGETGIRPIDSSLQKILKTGYAHHIERLMIFANFMNLCQFNPDEVYQWFMEMFIDSYDWVMVPNVYGMSSFSDGGKMSTKPYISGSNYIKKMSDYPDGEWTEQWDALFWNFINDNKDFFAKNPRLGMMLRTLEKMPEEKRKQHFKTAREFIGSLK